MKIKVTNMGVIPAVTRAGTSAPRNSHSSEETWICYVKSVKSDCSLVSLTSMIPFVACEKRVPPLVLTYPLGIGCQVALI